MPTKKDKNKSVDCPHKNTRLVVTAVYCTCEVVDEVCVDCGHVIRTLTDC